MQYFMRDAQLITHIQPGDLLKEPEANLPYVCYAGQLPGVHYIHYLTILALFHRHNSVFRKAV